MNMNPTPVARAEIYRQVRTVLVRHLIDVGRLTIQISMNHLHLQGTLRRLSGVTAVLTSQNIHAIFSELRLIRGVRRVNGEFDNWRQMDDVGASWVPITVEKLAAPPVTAPVSEVFDVKEEDKTSPSAPPAG